MSFRPRRSVLYMPGSNARAIEKARTLPADCIVLDLEDSVAPEAKAAARLPLSASILIRRWAHEAPRSLEEAQAQLRDAAAAPERVARWRRVVPIAMAAVPVLIMGLLTPAMSPSQARILNNEEQQVVGLLELLQKELPPGNKIVMGPDGLALGELKEPAAYGPVFQLTPTQGREGLGMTTGSDPVPAATAAPALPFSGSDCQSKNS